MISIRIGRHIKGCSYEAIIIINYAAIIIIIKYEAIINYEAMC
jgi:hypothetical protein